MKILYTRSIYIIIVVIDAVWKVKLLYDFNIF